MARSRARSALSSAIAALCGLLAVACQEAPKQVPCDALAEALGPELAGIRFEDQKECAEILRYLLGPVRERGLSPAEWFAHVRGQSKRVHLAVIEKLAIGGDIGSFEDFPAQVPCDDGTPISATDWAASPLSALRLEKPERMYYSFQLTTTMRSDGRVHATLTSKSNFDCDDVFGLRVYEGIATPGRNPFKGGWEDLGTTGTSNWVE